MKLFEIASKRDLLEKELKNIIKNFEQNKESLNKQINKLKELEECGIDGLNVEKIQLAEDKISVKGDIYGQTSSVTEFGGRTIAEEAIIDIANGCPQLKTKYFGNKTYERFYQRSDCEYGYRPKHGGIRDSISLKVRDRELTEEEKDACIYYLKNYKYIKKHYIS